MTYTLVTGASSGIGRSLAVEFARNGHNLIITARSEDKLTDLKHSLERDYAISVVAISCDLAESGAAERLYEQCRRFDIEVLINNAGFGDFSNVWDVDADKAQAMLNLNVQALTSLSLAYARDYKDSEATLINVASIGGYNMFGTAVIYCATKFYVASFTEGMAYDLEREGKPMRAKVLAPGATATEFFDRAYVNAAMENDTTADRSKYKSPDELAQDTYRLFESDKAVGYVGTEGQLELRDPIFPRV